MLDTLHKYVKQGWLSPPGEPPPRRAAVVSLSQGEHLKAFDSILLHEGGAVVASGTRAQLLELRSELAARVLCASDAANASMDDVWETNDKEANAAYQTDDITCPQSMEGEGGAAGDPPPAPVAEAALPVTDVSRLTSAEGKRAGAFSLGLYSTYIRALGRVSASIYLLLLFVTYTAYLWFDLWLTRWIRDEQVCGSSLSIKPTIPDCGRLPSSTHALIYAALGLSHVIALISTSIFMTAISVRASMSLHRDTISRVLYAPLAWYDATPSGRVLSRFTSDLNTVDVKLSMDIDNVLQMVRFGGGGRRVFSLACARGRARRSLAAETLARILRASSINRPRSFPPGPARPWSVHVSHPPLSPPILQVFLLGNPGHKPPSLPLRYSWWAP
jgi:hypothetical protein